MTKKLISGSCLFLVTILLLQVYQELVLLPRQTVTYQISMISYFLMFFGVELFYVCLGFLMTTMIRSHLERKVYWRIGLWMGLIPIILFVMMNLIYWMTLGSKDPWILSLRDVLYRCLLYPETFVVFGVLTGLGIPLDHQEVRSRSLSRIVVVSVMMLLIMTLEIYHQIHLADFPFPRYAIRQFPLWIAFVFRPLFYIGLGMLIMEGLLFQRSIQHHLPWLKWLGVALTGVTILSGLCILLGFERSLMFLKIYAIPEVFTVGGILLGCGLHSQRRQAKGHMEYLT